MSNLRIFLASVSAIVLFLYGLEGFSHEIQRVGGATLNKWLGRLTESRWQGVLLGAVAAAIVQSSSAVTLLTVALVDTGSISFRSSLGVLLGANVGTTSTAWLVSLRLTSIGLGKITFYFGFHLLQPGHRKLYVEATGADPIFAEVLSRSSTSLTGLMAGLLLTAIVQSSSIITGLCILLVQQNLMPVTAAIPVVIGTNIGTTATALIAGIKMQQTARRVALANLCFNIWRVLLFLPFMKTFAAKVVELAGDTGMAVAWAQLIFNLVMVLAVLLMLRLFHRQLDSLDANVSHAEASVV